MYADDAHNWLNYQEELSIMSFLNLVNRPTRQRLGEKK